MSAVEQMTLDSRSSTVFEGEEFLYRPIPSLVPVSMAFVFISLVAGIWDVLLIVPIVGASLACMAWRQIRRSQGMLSGGWLACMSLILQVAMLAGFAAMHAHTFATEVPPGYERINFTMNHEVAHVVTLDQATGSDRLFRALFHGKVQEIPEDPETMLYQVVPDFDLDESALVPGLKLAANQLIDYLERHR